MKLVVDTHTHTVSSGHAYSTIQEMAREASVNGIGMIAMTDHGPAAKGAPFLIYFGNMKVIPDEIYGVRILKGVETNIMDYDGAVDMPDSYLANLDFVLASFHEICIEPSGVEEHTGALLKLFENPYVDAVAHPGNPRYQIDIERVVRAARDYGKLIEINNQSFKVRKGSEENCRNIALACKKYGVTVVCGSDAHISFDVGRFDRVYRLFEEIDMPEELVLNTSVEKVEKYIADKRERLAKMR